MNDRPDAKGVDGELITDGEKNRIEEVVVFTDQAYIRRRARAKAAQGLNRFLVEVRAFSVDADSAQAGVKGAGVILSVQYREVPVRKALQEEVRELDDRKEELTRERETLLRDKEVLDKQVRFLDSVIDFGEAEVPKEVKTQFPEAGDLKSMLEFLGGNFRKLSEQDGDLAENMRKLDEEIEVVERKRRQLQGPRRTSRKVIELLFDSKEDQEIGIEVSYSAAKATWEPVYKVDVPLEVSHVDLTMFARIRQRTGENWSNVKLSVSNAVPLKGETLPDLERWDLTLTPPYVPRMSATQALVGIKGRDEPLDEADMLMDLDESALVAGAPEAEYAQAEQKELPLAFEYELPQQVGIDSGSGETLLPLYTKRLDGDFFIHAVPSRDPLAYLVCATARDSELLAGRLNIHFGGRFVGSAALTEKKAGEDLLVNLGVERGIKVRRDKVTDKVSETFFGMVDRSSAARELAFRIVVENLKDRAARVRLLDHVPVPDTDRIQVKGVETSPDPKTRDYLEREGVMLWEMEVGPKSTEEVRIRFFVKHPKETPPYGL